jgi:hypothetical protein
METKLMRTMQKCDVRDAAALHGKGIGLIYADQVLVIEFSDKSPHDGWVHVVGPNPPINEKGFYLKTISQAWIEQAHLASIDQEKTLVQLEINWTEKTWSIIK